MPIIKAIILGIVQGITEFLPISSSGHLSLFQHFMGVSGEGSLMFSVLLHVGTLIAVFIVFYKTIFELVVEFFSLLKDIFTGKFKFKELKGKKKMLVMFVFSCIPLLLLLIPVGNDMKLMDLLGGLSEDDSILVEGRQLLEATVGIGVHGAELQEVEHLVVGAYALAAVDDGAFALQTDGNGSANQQGGEGQQGS